MTKFRRVRIKENIYNTPEKYDIKSKSFINDCYTISLAESKKHLIKLILLEENLCKKLAISTTHKIVGELVFKSIICQLYDTDLNILPQYKNEVIGLLCGDGLYIYNCNNPSKSILTKELFVNEYTEKDDTNIDLSNMNTEDIKYGMSNNSFINLARIDKFNKLVEKYDITIGDIVEFDEGTELSTPKNNLLDDYENSVINQYQITKWIKTPTITAGISQNQRYFDKQFHFCLSGAVNCAENLQMWWRERRTNCKEIYFCFNEPIRPYRNLYKTDYIHNQLLNNYTGSKSLTRLKIEKTDYLESDNVLFRDLLAINLCNRLNSQSNYPQEFIKYLLKHTFTLYDEKTKTGNIKFLKDNCKEDEELDKEQKELLSESINRNILNFIHTDIRTFTKKELVALQQRKDKQKPISIKYKSINMKYNSLNTYMKFKSLTIYYWIVNELKEVLQKLKETDIIDKPTENLITLLEDTDYMNSIKDLYYNKYLTEINNEGYINTYQLHKYNSNFGDSYRQIKNIVKYKNPIKEYDELEIGEEKTLRQTKVISTLLDFLGIDINNLDNEEIIRYQIESDYKTNYVSGFKNEILSNDNKQTEEGVEVGFIDWFNNILLPHYRDITNISTPTLTALQNFNKIVAIIKIYLGFVNLEIDYGTQTTNQTKVYKNQQFTIKQKSNKITKEPTTIRVGYQSILPDLLTDNQEEYYNKLWDNPVLIGNSIKPIKIDNIDTPIRPYRKPIVCNYKRKQPIEDIVKDFDRPIKRIDYVKIKKDIKVGEVVCNEAKINDTLQTINSTKIKRNIDKKTYNDGDILLHTEKYAGFDPIYSDNKVNTRNNNKLYTKRIGDKIVALPVEEQLPNMICDSLVLDIIDNVLDDKFGVDINQQYEVDSYKKKSKYKHTDKQHYNSDKKKFVLDQIKRKKKENKQSIIDYSETKYELLFGEDKLSKYKSDIALTDLYKKNIKSNNNRELPQIILCDIEFMYKVIGEIYKLKYHTELDRETYDKGITKEIQLRQSESEDEYSSGEEEE